MTAEHLRYHQQLLSSIIMEVKGYPITLFPYGHDSSLITTTIIDSFGKLLCFRTSSPSASGVVATPTSHPIHTAAVDTARHRQLWYASMEENKRFKKLH